MGRTITLSKPFCFYTLSSTHNFYAEHSWKSCNVSTTVTTLWFFQSPQKNQTVTHRKRFVFILQLFHNTIHHVFKKKNSNVYRYIKKLHHRRSVVVLLPLLKPPLPPPLKQKQRISSCLCCMQPYTSSDSQSHQDEKSVGGVRARGDKRGGTTTPAFSFTSYTLFTLSCVLHLLLESTWLNVRRFVRCQISVIFLMENKNYNTQRGLFKHLINAFLS